MAYSPCEINTYQVFTADYLLGERVTIDQDVQVTALGVIASPAEPTSGVHGILALYADVGGVPSRLIARTASTTLGPGDNLIPVTPAASVPMGNYWMMAEYDVAASICVDSAVSNPIAYISVSYGALPATVTSSTASRTVDFNYYVLAIQ